MKIIQVAERHEDYDKMLKHFTTRTQNHIDGVEKYIRKIHKYDDERFGKILDRIEKHDQSKFKAPELEPYLYITWKYKLKDEGKEFDVPEDIADSMDEATVHHIVNNSHHPEYHCGRKTGLINTEDRDKPPKKIVDATKMPDLDIAEMCADWCSVSAERGNTPISWADKNVNVRWKFTDDQTDLIYELIAAIWD